MCGSVAPSVVEADAQVTLQVKVSCSPVCDLRGHTLWIKDHAGADVTRIELARFDGNAATETDEFAVKAPFNPGRYTWSVVSPAVVRQRVSCAEATSSVSFDVMPHTTNVVVDIPSAIVAGEKFKARVGIKCAHECSLAGRDMIWSDEATLKRARQAVRRSLARNERLIRWRG